MLFLKTGAPQILAVTVEISKQGKGAIGPNEAASKGCALSHNVVMGSLPAMGPHQEAFGFTRLKLSFASTRPPLKPNPQMACMAPGSLVGGADCHLSAICLKPF